MSVEQSCRTHRLGLLLWLPLACYRPFHGPWHVPVEQHALLLQYFCRKAARLAGKESMRAPRKPHVSDEAWALILSRQLRAILEPATSMRKHIPLDVADPFATAAEASSQKQAQGCASSLQGVSSFSGPGLGCTGYFPQAQRLWRINLLRGKNVRKRPIAKCLQPSPVLVNSDGSHVCHYSCRAL